MFGAAAPTAPCPCCSANSWRKAGTGFVCNVCHPDPRAAQVDRVTNGADPREHPLFRAAEAKGFPPASLAPFHPGASVIPTRDGWLRFVTFGAPEEIAAAQAALASLSPASAPDALKMPETTNSTTED
jgi:hypothetical protein